MCACACSCFLYLRYEHRGILQHALGPKAREERKGFEFDRDSKTWMATTKNITRYLEGITEADVSRDFVRALLQRSIEEGNEEEAEG